MPVTTCACGLDMHYRKKALVCSHCDGADAHAPNDCGRCKAIGLKPRG